MGDIFNPQSEVIDHRLDPAGSGRTIDDVQLHGNSW
jgi:hypothetical protein